MFTKQNKMFTTQMFTKQNTKQKVYKTKLKFTNTLCLQNKTESLQTRYVYKTRQNKCLQNQSLQTRYVYKTIQNRKFAHKLCLQNKTIQNKQTNKQKVYKTRYVNKKQNVFHTSYVYF